MEPKKNEIEIQIKSAIEATGVSEISDQYGYDNAGYMRRELKSVMKRIAEYWEPKKAKAHELHKSLVEAERDMIKPLSDRDKEIDKVMAEYRRKIEKERQEAEAERRRVEAEERRLADIARKAAEETERLVSEASAKDEIDDEDVEILRMAQADAQAAADRAEAAFQYVEIPRDARADGISIRRIWKARVVDEASVPVEIAGMMIRPVDVKALGQLARATSGRLKCAGVEFYQEEVSQVR